MSTNAQINANRENAKLSTGPASTAGLERSSRNATKHGLTCQTLLITPLEKEAYETHVQSYMDHHRPTRQEHRQLVQQLADCHWSIHQIFVQQTNTLARMNAIGIQMDEAGDPIATTEALVPVTRQLNTLSVYESRRRRAAKEIQAELDTLEQKLAEQPCNPNETQAESEIGSVCSTQAPDPTEDPVSSALEAWKRDAALLAQLEGEVGPEEAAKIRRQAEQMIRR